MQIPDLEASVRARQDFPRRSRRIARCLVDELAIANDGLGGIDLEGTGVARSRALQVRLELEPTFERHLLELEPGSLHEQVNVEAGGARSGEANVHAPGDLSCEGVCSLHVAGQRSEVDSLETSVDLGVEDDRWRHAAVFELDLGVANPQR